MRFEQEPKIRERPTIPTKAKILRTVIRTAISPLMPATVEGKNNLARAEELLKNGYGLVILYNHFSLRDPLQVLENIVFTNPSMRKKEVVAPIAKDQYEKRKMLLWSGAHLTNVSLCPIVTQQMLKDLALIDEGEYTKALSEQKSLFKKYNDRSIDVLGRSGIVIFTPQGTREEYLGVLRESQNGKKPIPPVASLVANLKHHKIDWVAFSLVGIGKRDETKYSIEGLNFGKPYTINIGHTYTKLELIELAKNSLRDIDQKIFEELSKLVPKEYLKPSTIKSSFFP